MNALIDLVAGEKSPPEYKAIRRLKSNQLLGGFVSAKKVLTSVIVENLKGCVLRDPKMQFDAEMYNECFGHIKDTCDYILADIIGRWPDDGYEVVLDPSVDEFGLRIEFWGKATHTAEQIGIAFKQYVDVPLPLRVVISEQTSEYKST